MRLIVGLGNPGASYAGTRHNVGFMVVDEIAKALGGTGTRRRWKAAVVRVDDLLLAKPETYMNLSGDSVYEIIRNNAIPISDIVVVLDDLDLPPGKVRIRAKDGSAGHKGMQSIISRLGTNEIARVKVGIGRPMDGSDPAEFVLQRPFGADKDAILRALETARDACAAIFRDGITAAMNHYNGTSGIPGASGTPSGEDKP